MWNPGKNATDELFAGQEKRRRRREWTCGHSARKGTVG